MGVGKAAVVGHDIGLMVAYAYAAQFPGGIVTKLVVMDAFLPGVVIGKRLQQSGYWHFASTPDPEALVKGRERIYFEHFWNNSGRANKRRSLSGSSIAEPTQLLTPGRTECAAGWGVLRLFEASSKGFRRVREN